MQFEIHQNRKHESDRRTAFMEQIRAHEPEWFAVTVGPDDLIDPKGPVELSNLPLSTYHLKLINVLRYDSGVADEDDGRQLYPVPVVVNTVDAVHIEGLRVVEAGKRD